MLVCCCMFFNIHQFTEITISTHGICCMTWKWLQLIEQYIFVYAAGRKKTNSVFFMIGLHSSPIQKLSPISRLYVLIFQYWLFWTWNLAYVLISQSEKKNIARTHLSGGISFDFGSERVNTSRGSYTLLPCCIKSISCYLWKENVQATQDEMIITNMFLLDKIIALGLYSRLLAQCKKTHIKWECWKVWTKNFFFFLSRRASL